MDWYRSSRYVMDSDPPGFRILKIPFPDSDGQELKWYRLMRGPELVKHHHDYQILMAEAEKLA